MPSLYDLVIEVMPSPGYSGKLVHLPDAGATLEKLLKQSPTIEQLQQALYLTVQMGDVNLAEMLVAKGANPAVRYHDDKGAQIGLLDLTNSDGKALSKKMSSFLEKHGASKTPGPAPTPGNRGGYGM